jgi:hypothetical protein
VAALRCLPALRAAEDRRLQNVDYRTRTFSCSKCRAAAYIAVIEPIKETGMRNYRLAEIDRPEQHPEAVDRLLGRRRRPIVDRSGAELPGRKVDGQR